MGKKYTSDGFVNELSLVEYVKLIKEDDKDTYFYELLNDVDVRRILAVITNKYKMSNGFFISEDVIYGICESELMLIIYYEMNVNLMNRNSEEEFKDSILSFIYKRLPGRVWRQLQKERPVKIDNKKKPISKEQKLKNEITEYFDIKDIQENGVWSGYYDKPENKYKYCEVFSGDFTDLAQISDEMQIYNTYGNGIEEFEDMDTFDSLINCCNENQQNILYKKFVLGETENQIGEDLGIKHESVHKTIERAKKRIKKNLVKNENLEY